MAGDVQAHVTCWLKAYLEFDHATQTCQNPGVLVLRLSVACLWSGSLGNSLHLIMWNTGYDRCSDPSAWRREPSYWTCTVFSFGCCWCAYRIYWRSDGLFKSTPVGFPGIGDCDAGLDICGCVGGEGLPVTASSGATVGVTKEPGITVL